MQKRLSDRVADDILTMIVVEKRFSQSMSTLRQSVFSLNTHLDKYAKNSGFPDSVTPHTMRHCFEGTYGNPEFF